MTVFPSGSNDPRKRLWQKSLKLNSQRNLLKIHWNYLKRPNWFPYVLRANHLRATERLKWQAYPHGYPWNCFGDSFSLCLQEQENLATRPENVTSTQVKRLRSTVPFQTNPHLTPCDRWCQQNVVMSANKYLAEEPSVIQPMGILLFTPSSEWSHTSSHITYRFDKETVTDGLPFRPPCKPHFIQTRLTDMLDNQWHHSPLHAFPSLCFKRYRSCFNLPAVSS